MHLSGLGMVEEGAQCIKDGREALRVAEQSGRAGLGHQHPTGVEPGFGDGVELLGVEQGGGAAFQGIDQV